jgi:hypothetical protein
LMAARAGKQNINSANTAINGRMRKCIVVRSVDISEAFAEVCRSVIANS